MRNDSNAGIPGTDGNPLAPWKFGIEFGIEFGREVGVPLGGKTAGEKPACGLVRSPGECLNPKGPPWLSMKRGG